MIVEYNRPESIKEALALLARTDVATLILGGGTYLNRPSPDQFTVVDLQSLGLNTLEVKGKQLHIGATVTLQQLIEFKLPGALKAALRHEATYNIRQSATIAGTLVASDGRSPLATTMLALDAELHISPDGKRISLGNYLSLRGSKKKAQLITRISIPNNIRLTYEFISRTPFDLPIVCVSVCRWPSDRTRVVLGGYGDTPLLAMDGPDPMGAAAAAEGAYQEAEDNWASAAYRRDMAKILTHRCIQESN